MLPDRFWSKVRPEGDCWVWTASTRNGGYGQFRIDGRVKVAHRLAFEELRDEIPGGLVLDHLCRNRKCVNPDHLDPVTDQVNIARGEGGVNQRRKTHCPQGHPYDEQNTRRYRTGRYCRTCGGGTDRKKAALYGSGSR